MPTDPINGLTGIMQALRERMASRSEKAGKTRKSATQSASRRESSAKADVEELERKIAARLRNLAPEKRNSPQAARIFVETALAWEFGDDTLNDPSFLEIAREVQQLISDSPQTRQRFYKLLAELGDQPPAIEK